MKHVHHGLPSSCTALFAPIYARQECRKALCTGMLATQAIETRIIRIHKISTSTSLIINVDTTMI